MSYKESDFFFGYNANKQKRSRKETKEN